MMIDVDGRPAYAYTGGRPFDPALPAVVLIHGAQHDHSVWALQSRYLAHHGRAVLAVDLPGHGRSAGPPLSTVEAMADWIHALLDAAGVRRASLVGHSMGSLIALEAASRRRDGRTADEVDPVAAARNADGSGRSAAGDGAAGAAGGGVGATGGGADTGVGAGVGGGVGVGVVVGAEVGVGAATGVEVGAGIATDAVGAGAGAGAGAEAGAEAGAGAGPGAEAGAEAEAGVAVGTGTGGEVGAGTDADADAPGPGAGPGVGTRVNAGAGAGVRMVTIDAIALIATAYPMEVSEALLAATRDDEDRAIEMISLWSVDTVHGGYSQKPSAPGPGFSVMTGGRRLMHRQPPGTLHNDFVACNAYRAGDAAVAAVRCPALFVLGRRDAMTPARSGRALAARMAGSRVVELTNIGHFVMAEAPDATLDALDAFLPRAVS